MGSIASRFQNFQLSPDCPKVQDDIGSDDHAGTNDSTVSMIEYSCWHPENVANIANDDNHQAPNPSVNFPEIQDETGAVSDSVLNDSTVSMFENSIGIPENDSNMTNSFQEPNTFNLDDLETASMSQVRHADDLESNFDSFADDSSVFGAASNMSESNFVTVAEESTLLETDCLTPEKTTLSKTPLPQNLGTGTSSSTLVLKNGTKKLSTPRGPRKSRGMTASQSATIKRSGTCRFCKLKMRKTRGTTTARKHKATRGKAKPFKIPKTVQTILKHTSDVAPPRTNAYHNFLLYYNVRCHDATVSERQRSTCRKARHVWKMMNAEEKLPFSQLARKERRKRLRRI